MDRISTIEVYEGQLGRAQMAARTLSTLHGFSRFLALCNLTWATVVLLGAFVSDLAFPDYSFIASLLLLESVRLASFPICTHLITSARVGKVLIRSSLKQANHSGILGPFLASLQAALTASTFVLPIIRLRALHYSNIPNLQSSLLIFYILVIINAVVSLVTLSCSIIALTLLYRPPEQSIIRYYDEILRVGLSSEGITDVLQPDNLEFFSFAYKILGKYFEDWQVFAVAKVNKELIRYLYAHRSGMDFLRIYLDADDAFVQQAAVSLVGFWAADCEMMEMEMERVRIPVEVLTKLADKLGTGQVAWGVATSFGDLAKRDQKIVAETVSSSGKHVVHRLAELVDASSARSLVYVRTLVLLFDRILSGQTPLQEDVSRALPVQQVEALVPKLKQLLATSKVHRLRVESAYLLHLLGKLDPSCIPFIKTINPTKDAYWFTSEVAMLRFFYQHIPADAQWNHLQLDDPHLLAIMPDGNTSITPPPWPQQIP